MSSPRDDHPVFELRRKLHSCIRTGRRLHLELDQLRILFDPRVLDALSQIEAEELQRLCRDDRKRGVKAADYAACAMS